MTTALKTRTPPVSQVARHVLAEAANPDEVGTARLLILTRARMEQLGFDPKAVSETAVRQAIQAVRQRYGPPLTKEKLLEMADRGAGGRKLPALEDYPKPGSAPPPPSPAPAGQKLSVVAAVRRVLLRQEDPEALPVGELVEGVRSEMAAAGGDNGQRIDADTISSHRCQLRERCGGTITRAVLIEYCRRLDRDAQRKREQTAAARRGKARPAPRTPDRVPGTLSEVPAAPVPLPRPGPAGYSRPLFLQAVELVRAAGGPAQARDLVALVEEARK